MSSHSHSDFFFILSRIREAVDAIELSLWPVLREVFIFENPLAVRKSSLPAELQAELVEKKGIVFHTKQPQLQSPSVIASPKQLRRIKATEPRSSKIQLGMETETPRSPLAVTRPLGGQLALPPIAIAVTTSQEDGDEEDEEESPPQGQGPTSAFFMTETEYDVSDPQQQTRQHVAVSIKAKARDIAAPRNPHASPFKPRGPIVQPKVSQQQRSMQEARRLLGLPPTAARQAADLPMCKICVLSCVLFPEFGGWLTSCVCS